MNERKKKSIFTILFAICIVALVGYLLKSTLMEEKQVKPQFYFVYLDDKNINKDEVSGEKFYTFEVTTKYIGNNSTPVETQQTYIVEVKKEIYDKYGLGSLLKAYFYGEEEKLYLAGLSLKEPLSLNAHSK